MIENLYRLYIDNDKMSNWLLIIVTVFSWLLFPLMIKQLHPPFFLSGFSICLIVASVAIPYKLTINKLQLRPLHKIMLVCWVGYLLALLLATFASSSMYSLSQWGILFIKFLFFIFLLLYINKEFIVTTLRIYANIMLLTVIFSLVAIIFVVLGVDSLTSVDLGGRVVDVYFGAFYAPNSSICMPAPIYRIQGLSEEPGTFGFILLPAFFWFLIVEKAYFRSAVIIVGLMFSLSLGAGLFLFILLPIIVWKYTYEYKVSGFFLAAISVIGLMYLVSNTCTSHYLKNLDSSSIKSMAAMNESCKDDEANIRKAECIDWIETRLSTTFKGKSLSYLERYYGLLDVASYLKTHKIGTGASLGINTINNSISVGYAIAVLESGIVGGVLYLCLFAIMGWLALKIIFTSNKKSYDEQVNVVIALSVCTVLMMGAQRMQPDLSFWHMWLYAIFFYMNSIKIVQPNRNEIEVVLK